MKMDCISWGLWIFDENISHLFWIKCYSSHRNCPWWLSISIVTKKVKLFKRQNQCFSVNILPEKKGIFSKAKANTYFQKRCFDVNILPGKSQYFQKQNKIFSKVNIFKCVKCKYFTWEKEVHQLAIGCTCPHLFDSPLIFVLWYLSFVL